MYKRQGLHLVENRLDEVRALVLTHGHEDHIGAVPYLLRRRSNIPVLGSRLTLALVREKLREHRIRDVDLRVVTEGDRLTIGEFDLEFLAVNHSIPDALAVVLRTKAGTVLHTGDFKMDQLPLDGRLTDLRGFARLGDEGLDLFLSLIHIFRGYVEQRVAAAIASQLGTGSTPTVSLGGTPFSLALITRAVPNAHATVDAVPLEIAGHQVELADVAASTGEIRLEGDTVTVATLTATGTLTYSDLAKVAELPVSYAGDGRLELRYTTAIFGRELSLSLIHIWR